MGVGVFIDCFMCTLINEHMELLEHESAKGLPVDDLWQVNWLPADIQAVKAIEEKTQV